MEGKKKYLYLETMRIFACFFMIFNHTNVRGFFLFSQSPLGSLQFWWYLWLSVFCKFAVPLFFMISGALLIPKENESLGDLYKNRVLRMVCTLLFFSAVFFVRDILRGKQTWDIGAFFLGVYEGSLVIPYWYLYTYIAFLITLPMIRAMAKNLEDKYYYYIFLLWFVFALIPVLQYALGKNLHVLNGNLNVGWLTTNIVLCPITGYFLQYRMKNAENAGGGKTVLLLWAANILTICLSCYMTYLRAVDMGQCNEAVSQEFHNTFAVLNAATIFLTVKYLYLKVEKKVPMWLNRAIASVGSATFGIYLMHILALDVFNQKLWDAFVDLHLSPMLSSFLVCLCTMAVCYVVTVLLKRIPLIRKLL